MCIEFLRGGANEDPMGVVSKVVYNYLQTNEPTEDGLKKHLADGKFQSYKNVNDDSNYKLIKTPTGFTVMMSQLCNTSGILYEITITDTEYSYKTIYHSDKEGYYDIVYNEYCDIMSQ